MSDFDHKQARIIRAWISRSRDTPADPYGGFIGLWIAFNAYCYGRYARLAHRNRADLRNDKALRDLADTPTPAAGMVVREPSRVRLEITKPGRLVIHIRERYTEDIIFAQFGKEHQEVYRGWLENATFATQVAALRGALEKNGRHYVINMAIADRYDPNGVEASAEQGVIVPFEDTSRLADLIDVLYQIRCNVFHGEKVPGEVSDDKIVKAAHPVLLGLLDRLVVNLPEEGTS